MNRFERKWKKQKLFTKETRNETNRYVNIYKGTQKWQKRIEKKEVFGCETLRLQNEKNPKTKFSQNAFSMLEINSATRKAANSMGIIFNSIVAHCVCAIWK